MPPLKQPVPLRDLAMETMITFFINFCHECKPKESLDKLREGIAAMKRDICPHIPWNLSAYFHEKFLEKIVHSQGWPVNFPESHAKAVLDLIMDRKIVGLRCTEKILTLLNPEDAPRIQGIKELEARGINISCGVDKFQLDNLTTLNIEFCCTDSDLEAFGKNCPKLEYLKASHSYITDKGLPSLIPCAKLRSVHFANCQGISHNGIIEFLSTHQKIEVFSAWGTKHSEDFSQFFQSDLKPCFTIIELNIRFEPVLSSHLRTIAVMFPNLRSLGLFGNIAGDLTILKSLRKLSRLEFSETKFSRNLKKLLTLIGANLTDLRFVCGSTRACVTQKHLNFMFTYCRNIESLKFDFLPYFREQNLIIPPFPVLKRLQCYVDRHYVNCYLELKFPRMAYLEKVTIFRSCMRHRTLTTLVVDHVKFPNLKLIQLHEVRGNYKINLLEKIARDNNLDLRISTLFMYE